jgi:hypothetical protein
LLAGWLSIGALVLLSACGGGSGGTAHPDGGGGSDAAQQEGGAPGSGDVHFVWTFAGGSETCAGAGVHAIQVMLAGALTTFPCTGAAGQSGTVVGVPAGDQSFTLSGLAVSLGSGVASGAGVAHVLAGQTVDVAVDLSAAKTGGGDVTFQWSFEGGKTCSDAGAAKVKVSIDGQVATFDCDGANGQQGTVVHVGAGQPGFTIVAGAAATGAAVAQASGQVLVTAGQTVTFPVVLRLIDPTTSGRLVLRWGFGLLRGMTTGCAGAKVERLRVQIGSGASFGVPCLDFAGPAQRQVIVPNVPAGPTQILVTSDALFTSGYGWSSGMSTVNVTAQQDSAVQVGLSAETINSPLNAVQFHWTFAGKTCAQAGVGQISVNVPNAGSMQATCNADGSFRLPNVFQAGTSSFTLSATATGGVVYGAAGSFITEDRAALTDVHVDLQPSAATAGTGSLALDFAFSQAEVDCASAGLDRVHLFLTDGNDGLVAGSEVTASCGDLPITLPSVASAGSYNLEVEGLMADGTALYTTELYNLTVTPAATSAYRILIY